MINKCRTAYSSVFDIYLIQLVEKVCIYICIYKNRANSLSLSPNPFPMGRGYITGATAPSPCRGRRPCDPIFKKYRFIDSLIYLIQRPCLFSVPAAFTQNIISNAGDVRRKLPIGMDTHIPITPKVDTGDRIYARSTLVPSERIVRITDINGLFTAL